MLIQVLYSMHMDTCARPQSVLALDGLFKELSISAYWYSACALCLSCVLHVNPATELALPDLISDPALYHCSLVPDLSDIHDFDLACDSVPCFLLVADQASFVPPLMSDYVPHKCQLWTPLDPPTVIYVYSCRLPAGISCGLVVSLMVLPVP